MNEVKAELKNYRQSPRKIRLVADAIRGKLAAEAITILDFIPKRAGLPIKKLISSEVANAKNLSIPVEGLRIKEIRVDAGPTLFRRRPRSRGMVNPIRKRTSKVRVVLVSKE